MKKSRILILFIGLTLSGVFLQIGGKDLLAVQMKKCHADERYNHEVSLEDEDLTTTPAAEFDGCTE